MFTFLTLLGIEMLYASTYITTSYLVGIVTCTDVALVVSVPGMEFVVSKWSMGQLYSKSCTTFPEVVQTIFASTRCADRTQQVLHDNVVSCGRAFSEPYS